MANLMANPALWKDADDVTPPAAWNPTTERYEYEGYSGPIVFTYIGPAVGADSEVRFDGNLEWDSVDGDVHFWVLYDGTGSGVGTFPSGEYFEDAAETVNPGAETVEVFFGDLIGSVAREFVNLSGYLSPTGGDPPDPDPECFWDHESMIGVSEDC